MRYHPTGIRSFLGPFSGYLTGVIPPPTHAMTLPSRCREDRFRLEIRVGARAATCVISPSSREVMGPRLRAIPPQFCAAIDRWRSHHAAALIQFRWAFPKFDYQVNHSAFERVKRDRNYLTPLPATDSAYGDIPQPAHGYPWVTPANGAEQSGCGTPAHASNHRPAPAARVPGLASTDRYFATEGPSRACP